MNFSVILHEKCVLIIPEDHPIILELFLILFTTDYSKNYSGIMYACLYIYNEEGKTMDDIIAWTLPLMYLIYMHKMYMDTTCNRFV